MSQERKVLEFLPASVASLLIERAETGNASLLLTDGGEYKDLPTFKVALI